MAEDLEESDYVQKTCPAFGNSHKEEIVTNSRYLYVMLSKKRMQNRQVLV